MQKEITKELILQTLEAHENKLREYGVIDIGLFGSFVRNEANADSDIDLLVDLEKEKKTFRNFMSLAYFLEELFKRKVELVTTQSISRYISPKLLKTVEYVSFADRTSSAYSS